jgi:SAM-dependent methyltransferase
MFECRNCTAARARPRYQHLPDRLHGIAGRFDYVSCEDCGLVQIAEIPPNLGEFYTGYRVHGSDSALYRALRKLTIGHCYYQAAGEGRALLDIGCGNGTYLREMAGRGWRAVGYELDPAYAATLAHAIELPVLSGDAALAARAGEFDLVTFNFSFEHLDQPRRLLAQVGRCLKPGGMIYLSVPNIESREAALFGDRWFHLDPPRHISFFTKAMLGRVLAESGFTAIETKDLPVPTGFAGSVSYRMFGRFQPLGWYAGIVPGLLFSAVVRDGNFAISGRRPA